MKYYNESGNCPVQKYLDELEKKHPDLFKFVNEDLERLQSTGYKLEGINSRPLNFEKGIAIFELKTKS